MTVGDLVAEVYKTLPSDMPRRVAEDIRLYLVAYNACVENLLSKHPWSFLHQWTSVSFPGAYETGTISLTQGSTQATGSGTSWASTHVGWYLIGVGQVPLSVAGVSSQTSLTLEVPWPGETVSGVSYRLSQRIASVSMRKLLGVFSRRGKLRLVTMEYLDTADPTRASAGDPWCYTLRGEGASGVSFEVYPTPTSDMVFRAFGLKFVTQAGLYSDVEFPYPRMIALGIRSDLMASAYAETGHEKWANMSQALRVEFLRALETAVEEDRASSAWLSNMSDDPDGFWRNPAVYDTTWW